MTVTADDKCRVILRDAEPGQSFDYRRDEAGRIILQQLKPVPPNASGEAIVLPLSEGRLPRAKAAVSREQIAQLIRDERDAR